MTDELVLTNARIVTAEEVVDGTLVVRGGRIAEIAPGRSRARERARSRRRLAAARPGRAAHRQSRAPVLAAAGRALAGRRRHADPRRAGRGRRHHHRRATPSASAIYGGKSERLDYLSLSIEVLRRAQAARALKADHFLHLRLEIADPHMLELFEPLMAEPSLRLVSFMDHTPGQRQ